MKQAVGIDWLLEGPLAEDIMKIAKAHNRSPSDEIRLAIETHIVKFKAEEGK